MRSPVRACDTKTLPYPGFPTDMQPQLGAVLSCAAGVSVITESVFENRFLHVDELKRMGAVMRLEGRSLIVEGVPRLTGARVRATDIRAGAALVLAGLAAEGETVISGVEHITRGHEGLCSKLASLGASLEGVVLDDDVKLPVACEVVVRYRADPVPARAEVGAAGGLTIHFARPVAVVVPGQYAVLYAGERVLGGGRIQAALRVVDPPAPLGARRERGPACP